MKPLNIGIIGCGRISDLHAAGYLKDNRCKIYAVCDEDVSVVERRKAEWGATKAYRNYRDLLLDPEIDAVDIITPHSSHEEIAIDAFQEKKHVSVQKPMSISLESADRMIKAGEESGKIFKLFENYVFYPPIALAKKLINQGEIGEPTIASFNFISGSSGGWYVPDSAWQWRDEDHEKGFGKHTFDHGHHMWSTAWFLMGEFDWVQSWIASIEKNIDSPAVITWKYKDANKYGVCDYSYSTELEIPSDYYACDEWFQIKGSRGIILINRCSGKVKTGPVIRMFKDGKWKDFEDVEDDWAIGFHESTKNFISAILGKDQVRLTGEEGRYILEIDLAIQESARTGNKVFINMIT